MVLRKPLPDSPKPLASFPSEEIASGLGIVTFLGISSQDNSAVDYHLITKSIDSQPRGTGRSSQGTTTMDFDTSPFNLPRTAKGTANLSLGFAATVGEKVRILARLKKYDGSTETNLSLEIQSQDFVPSGTPNSQMVLIELPITEKIIKKGELLRLTIKLVQVNAAGTVDMGHDPKNQSFNDINTSSKDTTVMTLLMPFRVDV